MLRTYSWIAGYGEGMLPLGELNQRTAVRAAQAVASRNRGATPAVNCEHPRIRFRIKVCPRQKLLALAGTFCQGHAVIQNLHRGFSRLTDAVAPRLRLAVGWAALAASL